MRGCLGFVSALSAGTNRKTFLFLPGTKRGFFIGVQWAGLSVQGCIYSPCVEVTSKLLESIWFLKTDRWSLGRQFSTQMNICIHYRRTLFPQLYSKCHGITRKDGARPALANFFIFIVMCVVCTVCV
jgi:hypothetical protein